MLFVGINREFQQFAVKMIKKINTILLIAPKRNKYIVYRNKFRVICIKKIMLCGA